MAVCFFCGSTGEGASCAGCGRARTPVFEELAEDGGLEGVVLADRYRLGALLGRGGMGRVFVAEQIGMQREVAVKVLRPSVLGDPANRRALMARFQREVLAVARLEHPNTIRVYDQGATEAGLLFLVMERLRGQTLAELLRRDRVLPPARVAEIGAQVCRSLAEAHERGVIHRDLKPDNVFLAEVHGGSEQVKVLDFGIAKVFEGPDAQGVSALTRSDMVIGTAAYMAPEQATGAQVQPASDLYALGAILFECLTGRVPYDGDTPVAVLLQHAGAPAPMLPDRVDGREIPRGLARLVQRLLEKEPDQRPGPTLEVATCLEAVAGELRRAEKEPAKRLGRLRGVALWLSAVLGALALGIGAGLWAGPGFEEAAPPASQICEPSPLPAKGLSANRTAASDAPARAAVPAGVLGAAPVAGAGTRAAPVQAPAGASRDAGREGGAREATRPAGSRVSTGGPAVPRVLPACREAECPFTHPCRDETGRTWKGDQFCFPSF